jgi:integrase
VSARLEKTKTPGVYRRGGRYVVAFRDQHGTPRKRSAATLAEARDLKASMTTDVRRGEYRTQSRVRFADYARDWATSYQGRTSRGIRPETLKDYAADLERHAIPFLGRLELAEIMPSDLKRLTAHLTSQDLSPATVRCVLAPVRALFATAYEDGVIRANPAARLRLIQPSSHQQQAKRKALTEEELLRLLDAVPPGWRLFFELLAHTGLRIGEAVALTWDDIDLGQRRLHVRRRRYRGRLDTPKSDYGIRTIPLAPNLAQALWRKRGSQPGSALVFTTKNGGYLDPSSTRARVLKPAARKAGLPSIGFHTLRHTCATTLFNHGLNTKQVQAWLGHHSPAFTLTTYIHQLPDQLPNPTFLDQITQPAQRGPTNEPHQPPMTDGTRKGVGEK